MKQGLLLLIALTLSRGVVANERAIYQKVIAQEFPGHVILKRSEFHRDAQKMASQPALVMGDFNGDGKDDFAAIVREVKPDLINGVTFDYYRGLFVVCHGRSGGQFHCERVEKLGINVPYTSYLATEGPKKLTCFSNDSPREMNVKGDIIDFVIPRKSREQYVLTAGSYAPCGSPL